MYTLFLLAYTNLNNFHVTSARKHYSKDRNDNNFNLYLDRIFCDNKCLANANKIFLKYIIVLLVLVCECNISNNEIWWNADLLLDKVHGVLEFWNAKFSKNTRIYPKYYVCVAFILWVWNILRLLRSLKFLINKHQNCFQWAVT